MCWRARLLPAGSLTLLHTPSAATRLTRTLPRLFIPCFPCPGCRYLENVPTIVPVLEREYRNASRRLEETQSELNDMHPEKLKVRVEAGWSWVDISSKCSRKCSGECSS